MHEKLTKMTEFNMIFGRKIGLIFPDFLCPHLLRLWSNVVISFKSSVCSLPQLTGLALDDARSILQTLCREINVKQHKSYGADINGRIRNRRQSAAACVAWPCITEPSINSASGHRTHRSIYLTPPDAIWSDSDRVSVGGPKWVGKGRCG